MRQSYSRRLSVVAIALVAALFSFGGFSQTARADDQPVTSQHHHFHKMVVEATQADVQVGRVVRLTLEPNGSLQAHSLLLLPAADQIKNHHHGKRAGNKFHKLMKNPAEHGGLTGTINAVDARNLTLTISGLQIHVAQDAKVMIPGEGKKDLSALTAGMRVHGFGKVTANGFEVKFLMVETDGIMGSVQRVVQSGNDLVITVLGQDIRVPAQVKINQIKLPAAPPAAPAVQ